MKARTFLAAVLAAIGMADALYRLRRAQRILRLSKEIEVYGKSATLRADIAGKGVSVSALPGRIEVAIDDGLFALVLIYSSKLSLYRSLLSRSRSGIILNPSNTVGELRWVEEGIGVLMWTPHERDIVRIIEAVISKHQ